ncbi:ABC transporter permease [Paracoccus pantotrophus]|uniref:ABC transporter permease n=1 Tax=Paracoccus pantotrophus TaxID=82367 RepID=UPI001C840021|nr:ABC transporter permease [Paracoccus pantotrophus]
MTTPDMTTQATKARVSTALAAFLSRNGTFEVLAGLLILTALLVLAFAATHVVPADPSAIDFEALMAPPSVAHPFGTDHLGRDVFSRTVFALRIDLWMGVAGVAAPLVIGTALGLVAGYFGGWADAILSRIVDVTVAFPFFVLVIAIIGIMGPGLTNYFIALAFVGWVSYARLVRAQTAVLRDKDYVQAARVLGYSTPVILFRHVMPATLPVVLVYATTDIVMIVLAGASLGFLGLGVQPPTPEWGAMIAEGQPYVVNAWWICLFPGLAAIVMGFGFVLLSDGLSRMIRQ